MKSRWRHCPPLFSRRVSADIDRARRRGCRLFKEQITTFPSTAAAAAAVMTPLLLLLFSYCLCFDLFQKPSNKTASQTRSRSKKVCSNFGLRRNVCENNYGYYGNTKLLTGKHNQQKFSYRYSSIKLYAYSNSNKI